MARYTDIDLLIESVEETDWYHISKQGVLTRGANSKVDIPLYKHSDIEEMLNNASIADVVPKSEVEELKAIIADYKVNEEQWQELYADTVSKWEKAYEELEIKLANSKAEVAREIFGEIEKHKIVPFGSKCEVIPFYIVSELKKKYTEV